LGSSHAPSPGREAELLLAYEQTGDLAARAALIERFMPLARDLALRYRHTGEPLEDLTQVACVGLMKALDRFDPSHGSRFVSYAVPTILGELKRHFRDRGWALHVPRGVQERALRVTATAERLAKRLGRSPTVREVAQAAGMSTEQALEAMEAAAAYETTSLEAPGRPTDDGESQSLADTMGADEHGYEVVELASVLAPGVGGLQPREREILRLRFEEDLTQREIGERLGISQMHVSRLLRRALARVSAAAA
jgi:RNA polymerase sigma-B factor